MLSRAFFAALLSASVIATPLPDQNVPITDAEWEALRSNGLIAREINLHARGQNVPITNAEWDALRANGLIARDGSLRTRDNVMNCGNDITGKVSIGGNGVGWVPVAQFYVAAEQFCNSYTGTDISMGHETSDTYPVYLTNQKSPSSLGAPGNIAFAIYNTARNPTYLVDADTCLEAMKAPLNAYLDKGHKNGRGDECYGSKNNDYEGGYYLVEGVGAFGSEVRKAPS